MRRTLILAAVALSASALSALTLAPAAHADTPQHLSAQVGDVAFESGDDDILLVPLDSSFTLSASTLGSAAWPPPKTRIDRLAITCDGFETGKPLRLDQRAFERSTCDVTFERGTKSMGGEPDAAYHLDKGYAGNRFEITRADGKRYEGTFAFRLKGDKGETIEVGNGTFRIEDRQL